MTLTFPRADPAELDRFDPETKRCTMNCGPHRDDPRSEKERRFLCDECETVAQKKKTNIAQEAHMETMTVMMPRSLTAENGAKKLFIGEFHVEVLDVCDSCGGDGWENEETGEECRECNGECSWKRKVPVPWSTIKKIYSKAVECFGN